MYVGPGSFSSGTGYAVGAGTPDGAVDAVRFGQTYADVTPTAAVPEPGVWRFLGWAGCCWHRAVASRYNMPGYSYLAAANQMTVAC